VIGVLGCVSHLFLGLGFSKTTIYAITQGKEILLLQVSHQVRFVYGGIQKPRRMKVPRVVKSSDLDNPMAWGYLDGASQGSPSMCGAGGILFLIENHLITFKVVFGQGTNNKA